MGRSKWLSYTGDPETKGDTELNPPGPQNDKKGDRQHPLKDV